MKVRVGLPSGNVHEVELDDPSPTVHSVRNAIAQLENIDTKKKRVRLIHAGKVLEDGNTPLKNLIEDGTFLHCAISEMKPVNQLNALDSGPAMLPVPLSHLNQRGTVITFANDVHLVLANASPRILDNLESAGFTPEEVELIRREARYVHTNVEPSSQGGESPTTEVQRVISERMTQIDEGGDDQHILSRVSDGSNNDFLAGIVLGFLLGLIMIVLLLDRNLSRRWRIGILAGVGCNISFGLLRSTLIFQSGFGPPRLYN